jgi:molybdopterin molybdotransferase
VTDLGILRDNRDAIEAGLKAAAEAHDLVVTSGGVSAGEEDHVRAAIAGGGSLVFWRLAIKPGRPVAMGVMNGTPVVGLPGNPVAVFVTFAHIVRPLIAAMVGAIATPIMPSTVIADFCYRKKAGRREYLRVSLERRGTETIAKKYPVDGAGIITSLTRTDGLIDLAEDRLDVERGDPVPFIDYRQLT